MTRQRQTSSGPRGNGPLDSGVGILFLAGFPMILLFFQGSASNIFAAALQLALFVIALWLIHRGQEVAATYEAAENARAPRLPRKAIGALLVGLVVLIMAGRHFVSLPVPLALGAVASLLTLVAFGMDPLRDKGRVAETSDQPSRRERMLDDMSEALSQSVAQVAELGDADLTRRLEALTSGIDGLVRAFSSEPSEARRLRKPISKFIELLDRENAQLVESWAREDRTAARKVYLSRIAALAQAFEERARRSQTTSGRDAYELEADLLWTRMHRKHAA